jgi:LacI family transcriptional regulator
MELQRKDITVVGYDTSPLVLECLYNDYCDAIIYQNPYLQGYMSVKSMAQYLLNKSLPNDNLINISSRIITKYNAKMVISANC